MKAGGILHRNSTDSRNSQIHINNDETDNPKDTPTAIQADKYSVRFFDEDNSAPNNKMANELQAGFAEKVRFSYEKNAINNTLQEEDEDYSASISAILQRKASSRRGKRRVSSPFSHEDFSAHSSPRRRSSGFTTTSNEETGMSGEESQVTQEQIYENIRLHKEVITSCKLQPWSMRRKLKLVQQAKAYVKKHEGELQVRLKQSRSTRDILARFNIVLIKKWQHTKRELANTMNVLIPWELRIKEVESHFGSVVASYFIFLRWLFWVNLVISAVLAAFVITPEILLIKHTDTGERKTPLAEEMSSKLDTFLNFDGVIKYSPLFYGYYSNNDGEYRLPTVYFVVGLAVYVYSFVATLRKMAINFRLSKLSEKEDECIFTWKLFTGWDYMIGNAETAHNRTSSIVLSFKEALLEEAEKKKEKQSWKIITLRVFVNINVIWMLICSALAVVYVVHRSNESEPNPDETLIMKLWHQNELSIVMAAVGNVFPMVFEIFGFLERYHPRKTLRIQLARIMALNLLNLYTMTISLFVQINGMTKELQQMKTDIGNTTYFKSNVSVLANISQMDIVRNLSKRSIGSTIEISPELANVLKNNGYYNDENNPFFYDMRKRLLSSTTNNDSNGYYYDNLDEAKTTVTYLSSRGKNPNRTVINNVRKEELFLRKLFTDPAHPISADMYVRHTPRTVRETDFSTISSSEDKYDEMTTFGTDLHDSITSSIEKGTSTTTITDVKDTTTTFSTEDTELTTITTVTTDGIVSTITDEQDTAAFPSDTELTVTDTKGVTSTIIDENNVTTSVVQDTSTSDSMISTKDEIIFDRTPYAYEFTTSIPGQVSRESFVTEDLENSTSATPETTTEYSPSLATTPIVWPDTRSSPPEITITQRLNVNATAQDDGYRGVTTSSSDVKKPTTLSPSSDVTIDGKDNASTSTASETVQKSSVIPTRTMIIANATSTDITGGSSTVSVDGGKSTQTTSEKRDTITMTVPSISFPTATSMATTTSLQCSTFGAEVDKPADDEHVLAEKVRMLNTNDRLKLRKLCWETMFGQELVKITVMDLVTTIGSTFFMDFVRALLVRYMNKCWCWDLEKKFPKYGDFKIAENILHLVNNQGMVWMGMFFSPGLPLINTVKLVIMMYLRSWAVLTCNVPHEVVFRASRSNNFYLALLLTMLFLCILPVGYAIVWMEPSWHCGPFSNYKKIYFVFTRSLKQLVPKSFRHIVDYIASPGTVIPLLLILLLVIYYLASLTSALREANNDLKVQLRRERTEERKKMFQMANRRRRGGSEVDSTFDKWRKILQDVPSGKHSVEDASPVPEEQDTADRKFGDKKFIRNKKSQDGDDTDLENGSLTHDEHVPRVPILKRLFRQKKHKTASSDNNNNNNNVSSSSNNKWGTLTKQLIEKKDSNHELDKNKMKKRPLNSSSSSNKDIDDCSVWSAAENIPEIKISHARTLEKNQYSVTVEKSNTEQQEEQQRQSDDVETARRADKMIILERRTEEEEDEFLRSLSPTSSPDDCTDTDTMRKEITTISSKLGADLPNDDDDDGSLADVIVDEEFEERDDVFLDNDRSHRVCDVPNVDETTIERLNRQRTEEDTSRRKYRRKLTKEITVQSSGENPIFPNESSDAEQSSQQVGEETLSPSSTSKNKIKKKSRTIVGGDDERNKRPKYGKKNSEPTTFDNK